MLQDGVTGWIDAGSQGADHIADTIAVARSAPQPGRVLINIGRAGILPDGDTMDLARADVAAARDAIAKNRDFIVGVKARLSRDVAGANDYEVLRRAQEVATAFNLPVMIHMGQTISPLPKLCRSPEARRHRHPHVRAAAQQHRRRQRPHPAGSAGGEAPRRLVRRRQRADRTHAVGHRRRDHEGRLLAGYVLDRLEHEQPHRRASSTFPTACRSCSATA